MWREAPLAPATPPVTASVLWRKRHKRPHNPSTTSATQVSRWRCVVRAAWVVGLALGFDVGSAGAVPLISANFVPGVIEHKESFTFQCGHADVCETVLTECVSVGDAPNDEISKRALCGVLDSSALRVVVGHHPIFDGTLGHYHNFDLLNFCNNIGKFRQFDGCVPYSEQKYGSEIISGCLTCIFDNRNTLDLPMCGINDSHISTVNSDISRYLSLGILISASDESTRRPPQSQGSSEQKSREQDRKRVGNLEPVAVERRPKLGSFLCSLFCIAAAFPVSARGQDAWYDGNRVRGALWVAGAILLGLSAILGMPLGLDPYSLIMGS